MTIQYVPKPHSSKPGEIILEIWQNGTFIAGLYCEEHGGYVEAKLISKYLGRSEREDGMTLVAKLNTFKGPKPS